MKAEELKGKTPDELKALLVEVKKKQFNLRFQRSQGQLENTAEMRVVRRAVARVKTFLQMTASAQEQKAPAAKKAAKAAGNPR